MYKVLLVYFLHNHVFLSLQSLNNLNQVSYNLIDVDSWIELYQDNNIQAHCPKHLKYRWSLNVEIVLLKYNAILTLRYYLYFLELLLVARRDCLS